MAVFSDLKTTADSTELAFTDSTGSDYYAFQLGSVEAEMTVDPTYQAVEDMLLDDVSAVAVMEASVAALDISSLIQLQVDSDEISSADDPHTFKLDVSMLKHYFTEVSWSEFKLDSGSILSTASDQKVAADVVRSLAFDITGGYTNSNIFSNEELLRADVSGLNTTVTNKINTVIDNFTNAKSDSVSNEVYVIDGSSVQFDSTYELSRVLNNALAISINDSNRAQALFDSIKLESNGGSRAAVSDYVNLPLYAGDVITVKVTYKPASSTFGGDGFGNNSDINDRSYRMVMKIV